MSVGVRRKVYESYLCKNKWVSVLGHRGEVNQQDKLVGA